MKRSLFNWVVRSRRALKALDRLVAAQEQQTVLLARIADRVAGPVTEPLPPDELRRVSSVSFSRDEEQGRILDFIARVERDTGHSPTEDEVLAFLEGQPT